MRIEQKHTDTPATLKELALRHKLQGTDPLAENTVVYEPIDVKTILTRNPNPALRHYWSINPYRGCQFGCTYCFARYTAGFVEIRDPLEFERRIFYKRNAPEIARRLRDKDFYGKPVALGTGTDPWQPAEGKFRITRGILEALLRFPSLELFCLTKSSLIRRDADLFRRLVESERPVAVGFSITSLDVELSKKMEPQAALPQERLKTMRLLSNAGVEVGVMVMPVVPMLTDSDEQLDALIGAARDHGATFIYAGALHLRSAPKERFMPWVEETFPDLAPEFRRIYGSSAYHGEAYQHELRERVARLKAKHGFKEREHVSRQLRKGEQLRLL
jgi:DNA repair photolyase